MSERKIFMDHVSTTPCEPQVLESMLPYFSELYGNPSSQIHHQGIGAAKAIDAAREPVKTLAGSAEASVVFTSGATEANNLALLGLALSAKDRKHVIVSTVEHFSVYNTIYPLRAHGYEVDILPVNIGGLVEPESLAKMIRDDTALVSVQQANPEIGAIQPLAELAEIAHEKGALFHSDATISAGLVPIEMDNWKLDAVTLSAHNIYGPKGTGALLLADGVRPKTRSHGGWQEMGLRSGTENVPAIVGFGKAAELAVEKMEERVTKLNRLGAILREGLAEKVRFIHFTGQFENRLPGHVSFWVEHVEGESLILFLNVKGVMAASGSACSSNFKAKDEDELVASHVLAAVGVPTDICAGSVCLSLGMQNTEEDVQYVIEQIPQIVERLLTMSPSYADYMKSQS